MKKQAHSSWTTAQMPSLRGRRAIVTGANSGIGYVTVLELARAGAAVTLAVRDPQRGQVALTQLRAAVPTADATLAELDLASLASVRAFAERERQAARPLDLLINNAGVMALPTRELTVDGYERQLATNHLGHFALTGLLLPLLEAAPSPRVVTVSSSMAWFSHLRFDNLQSERRYTPMGTYGQSKVANLLFMTELARRGGPHLVSVSAHPGAAITNLQRHAFGGFVRWFGQPAEQGALPSLFAAVGDVESGAFYGPRDRLGMVGPPARAWLPKRCRDAQAAAELWSRSEKLAGVDFAFTVGAAAHAS